MYAVPRTTVCRASHQSVDCSAKAVIVLAEAKTHEEPAPSGRAQAGSVAVLARESRPVRHLKEPSQTLACVQHGQRFPTSTLMGTRCRTYSEQKRGDASGTIRPFVPEGVAGRYAGIATLFPSFQAWLGPLSAQNISSVQLQEGRTCRIAVGETATERADYGSKRKNGLVRRFSKNRNMLYNPYWILQAKCRSGFEVD